MWALFLILSFVNLEPTVGHEPLSPQTPRTPASLTLEDILEIKIVKLICLHEFET